MKSLRDPLTATAVFGFVAVVIGACDGSTTSTGPNPQARKACQQSANSNREPGYIYTLVGCNESGASTGDGVLATAARVSAPNSAAFDQAGNLYFADRDDNRIYKVSSNGLLTTVVGTGSAGNSGDGAPAKAAQINHPTAITFDRAGNLYIAEFGGDRVRKVDTKGVITRVVGTGMAGYSGDRGPAAAAQLSGPSGLAFDSVGNLYITELNNNSLRRVDPRGLITTVAGGDAPKSLGDGGPAVAAQLVGPTRVFIDSFDNVYIADAFNHRVRKVNGAGVITTVVGNGTAGSDGDGGPAVMASINGPHGIAIDAAGNLYIAELRGFRVRKVSQDGVIKTVAGTGQSGFSGDGGPATSAKIGGPGDVAVDAVGNLYILDRDNGRIRLVFRPS